MTIFRSRAHGASCGRGITPGTRSPLNFHHERDANCESQVADRNVGTTHLSRWNARGLPLRPEAQLLPSSTRKLIFPFTRNMVMRSFSTTHSAFLIQKD